MIESEADAQRESLLEHIEQMTRYWNGDIDPRIAELSKREALDGLVFSILVMIDGGAEVGPYSLLALAEGGTAIDLTADRELHEQFGTRQRQTA